MFKMFEALRRLFPARARARVQPARAGREPAGHVRLVRRPFDWQVQLPDLGGDR